MKVPRVLATAALGIGLGTVALPGVAFADVTATPSTAPVGSTITLNSSCSIQFGQATFRIRGGGRNELVTSTGSAPGLVGGLAAQVDTTGFEPATYQVTATCGNGESAGETSFTLTPAGGPAGGDGGRSGGGTLATAGTVLLGGAAVSGLALVRRRRAGIAGQ